MSTEPERRNRPASPQGGGVARYGACAAETVVATIAVLAFIGSKSLWLDEAVSAGLASIELGDLFRVVTQREANMGLYYVTLNIWSTVGTGEAALRAVSAAAGIATVPVVFEIARRLFGWIPALAAGLFLALNQFFVRYSQEARGYSLVLLFVSLASLLFVMNVERTTTAKWIAYAVFLALGMYTHFFAALVPPAHAASLLFLERDRRPWKGFLLGLGGAVALSLPLAVFVATRNVGQIDWIPEPSVARLFDFFGRISGDQFVFIAYGVLAVVALVLFMRGRGADERPSWWPLAFAGLWFFVPVVASFVVSFVKPVFLDKYLIVSLPGLVLLAAAGVGRLGRRAVQIVAVIVVVGLSVRALVGWYSSEGRENWRAAARYVAGRMQEGDGLVFPSTRAAIPFDYYMERLAPGIAEEGFVYAQPEEGVAAELDAVDVIERRPAEDIGDFERVWMIEFAAGGGTRSLRAQIVQDFTLVEKRTFKGVKLALYER